LEAFSVTSVLSVVNHSHEVAEAMIIAHPSKSSDLDIRAPLDYGNNPMAAGWCITTVGQDARGAP